MREAGERQNRLFAMLGFLRGRGASPEDLSEVFPIINEAVCEVPLPEDEVTSMLQSIGSRPRDSRAVVPSITDAAPAIGPTGFISARAFIDLHGATVDYLWNPLLGRGHVGLFAGAPKSGKSTLLGELLRALVRGRQFLGNATTLPDSGRPCVWILTEEALSLSKRLSELGLGNDLHVRINERSFTWQEVLTTLEMIPEGDIVIIDTLAGFWPLKGENSENDNAQVNAAMRPLVDLTQGRRLAVIVVHHMAKSGQPVSEPDVLRYVRGSSALVAAVDVAAGLMRVSRHSNRRRLVGIGRFGSFNLLAELDENGYQLVDADGQHSGDTGISQAGSFLRATLSNGPVRATEMEKRAKDAGISMTTLNRAKKALNVRSAQRRDGWYWELP